MDTPESFTVLFLPQKLTRSFPVKEVRPLPIASMIKFVTFDIKLVFATTTFSLKLVVD